jgi:protein SCO1/2
MTLSTARRPTTRRLAVLGCWVMLSAAAAYGQDAPVDHSKDMSMADHMAMMPEALTGGDAHGVVADFDLVDRDGKPVRDEDFRGQYVLLGFGFTHCEHICPLMALNMGRVVAASQQPITGIFVSVDTERDSPAVSDDYAAHFGKSMIGLGGSIEQINAAAKNFKVRYAVTKSQDTYTVQHTANIFLIDPDGVVAEIFSFSAAPDEILEAID